MVERVKISYSDDDKLVCYYVKGDDEFTEHYMSIEQWNLELAFTNLVKSGTDEKLLDDFRQAVYSRAYDEAELDFKENNAL